MRARKVIITVEVKTELSHADLKGLQALVFGRVRRKNSQARNSRCTIRREVPKWVGHDTKGTIEQVQVNVIDKRPSSKARKAKKVAAEAPAAAAG